VGIAKEQGHEFTADKINQLTEEDLEGVVGQRKSRFSHGLNDGYICF